MNHAAEIHTEKAIDAQQIAAAKPETQSDDDANNRRQVAREVILLEDARSLELFYRLAHERMLAVSEITATLNSENAVRWTAGLVQAGIAVLMGRYLVILENGVRFAQSVSTALGRS